MNGCQANALRKVERTQLCNLNATVNWKNQFLDECQYWLTKQLERSRLRRRLPDEHAAFGCFRHELHAIAWIFLGARNSWKSLQVT